VRGLVEANTARKITRRVIAWKRPWSGIVRADRPANDLACRDLLDQLPVPGHPLAVERRQHQLALAHVRGPSRRRIERLPNIGSIDLRDSATRLSDDRPRTWP